MELLRQRQKNFAIHHDTQMGGNDPQLGRLVLVSIWIYLISTYPTTISANDRIADARKKITLKIDYPQIRNAILRHIDEVSVMGEEDGLPALAKLHGQV